MSCGLGQKSALVTFEILGLFAGIMYKKEVGKPGVGFRPAIFISYDQNQGKYKLLEFNADEADFSRDVLFDE